MTDRVSEIRARVAAATPGPWQWFGNLKVRDCYLATTHSGRRYVMGFERWGMRGAQPVFQVKNGRDGVMVPLSALDTPHKSYSGELLDGIAHPDAALIAHAPDDLAFLLAEVERLRADAARLDWLCEVAAREGKIVGVAGICYASVYVGRRRIAEGDDVRDAIDAAMQAETEVTHA